jgi:hypothetical protein
MLERLHAWREENKKKLVSTWPACACPEGSCVALKEYPMGPWAVVNRWFQTLPKTVVL